MSDSSGRHSWDKRQLVLGAALRFDVSQIRVFVESLRASGYAGDIAMLVDLTSRRPVDYLRRHGAQPIRTWCVRRLHGPIHSYRYACFAAYLREHGPRYDQVLISDVRDVVFQSHPFIGVTSPACHFFLESARVRLGSEPNNARWMRIFLPPGQAAQLAEYPVTCCGVVLGGIGAMALYLERMSTYIRAVPFLTRRKHGADTVFHNVIAHLTREVDCTIVENNRHVATMATESPSIYVLDEKNQIRLRDNHMPSICHQYDRIPEFRRAVENLYPVTD